MENLSEIKRLHMQVQKNIFRILIDYKVLNAAGCTLSGKPFYCFSEDYKFMLYETPMEVASFINSINRLLETQFLSIVCEGDTLQTFFINTTDFELLSQEEKEQFIIIPDKTLDILLSRERKFSFSGETL